MSANAPSAPSIPNAPLNSDRRLWITVTSVAGGAGLVAAAVPFVTSFEPSERTLAQGGPVEVDLTVLKPGKLQTVEWRGKPVWVLKRTPEMLASLAHDDSLLADPLSKRSEQPAYAKNPLRSVKPELLVLVGICTHLGCIPTFRPTPASPDLGASWPGGFYCPCHGSKFDLAGRVFKNVPAPINLQVPPYEFASADKLIVGVDPKS